MAFVKFATTILLGILFVGTDARFRKVIRRDTESYTPGKDAGEPLFVTPLINAGELELAKNLSRVGQLNGTDVVSYSGFLTVDPKYDSNMFFWFVPALTDPSTAPVALWLQGGPGAESTYGLLVENGPFYVDVDLNIHPREYTWVSAMSMLYIDNPVGTGFSFTNSSDGYSSSEEEIANNLYEALQQFFTLFSEYRSNDFYLSGESYAGKYVPSIAYKIHTENPTAQDKINLAGLILGNAWIDGLTMLDYGSTLYTIGLLDEKQRDHFLDQQSITQSLIFNGRYTEAFWVFDVLLDGDLFPYPTYFYNMTGVEYYLNYLLTVAPADDSYYFDYIQLDAVRKAIHIGNLPFNDGAIVEEHLIDDVFASVKPWFQTLLDNDYRILLYTGQVDIIVGYPLVKNFINSLQWKFASEYIPAERIIWKVDPLDDEVAGYVKQVHNFYDVLLRDAGHIVPYDQPRACYDMITKFINQQPFA